MKTHLRPACESDELELQSLIFHSVHGLQAESYQKYQRDAAIGPVFSVDRQLVRDSTYYVVEISCTIVACGGWSFRPSLYGGGERNDGPSLKALDPRQDAARIRAFFVHPQLARQGLGTMLLEACESAIVQAGFGRAELAATLAGEPFYVAFGYHAVERYELSLPGAVSLPVVRMEKTFGACSPS